MIEQNNDILEEEISYDMLRKLASDQEKQIIDLISENNKLKRRIKKLEIELEMR